MTDLETLQQARRVINHTFNNPDYGYRFDTIGSAGIGQDCIYVYEMSGTKFPSTLPEDVGQLLFDNDLGDVEVRFCSFDSSEPTEY